MAIEIKTYFPEKVLTNEEIEEWHINIRGKHLTAQALYDKLGIQRRFLTTESILDMEINAINCLPAPPSPDVVYFSTSYPNGVNHAEELIRSFGFTVDGFKNIHAACSGFTLALADIYQGRERYAKDRRILIASSEDYAPYLIDLNSGMEDLSLSQTIFSAGATSFTFQVGKDMEIHSAINFAFPKDKSRSLKMPLNYNLVRHPALTVDIPPSDTNYLWMDGGAVYKAVNSILPDVIVACVKDAKLNPRQIKLIIPHQASKPMLDGLSDRLPDFDLYRDLEDGNWSSASIPKATNKALKEGAIGKGDFVVFAGFGAGLFASVAVVKLN